MSAPPPPDPRQESPLRPFIPLTRHGWPELVALAFALRLAIALWTATIAPDCVVYLPSAEFFRQGMVERGLEAGLHPLYPLMSGLLGRLTHDVELSSVIVSVAAGSLIPLPFFLFIRMLWNERVAWVAGFLCALQPVLALDTTEAYPTGLFMVLFFAAMACGIRAWTSGRWFLYPVAGVLSALAYLTRTEGIHAAVFLGLGAAGAFGASFFKKPADPAAPTTGPSPARRRLLLVAGAFAGVVAFGVVSYPYLSYMHHRTGRWTLTLKTGQLLMNKAVGVEEEGAREIPSAADAISEHESLPRYLGKKITKALFGPLVPFYIAGLFCLKRQEGRWRNVGLLLIMALLAFVPTLLLLALSPNHKPSHRYMLLSGVLLLPLAAAGVLSLADFLSGLKAMPFLRRTALPGLLLAMLIALPLKCLGPIRPEEATYKDAGRWLKDQALVPSRTVLCAESKICYYGRCEQVVLPSQWSDLNKPPPELHLRKTPLKGLESAEALDWAKKAREEFVLSHAALLVVDQRSVDHFFGPEYLKQLETVGFREKTVISRDPREKCWTIWIYSLEKS